MKNFYNSKFILHTNLIEGTILYESEGGEPSKFHLLLLNF